VFGQGITEGTMGLEYPDTTAVVIFLDLLIMDGDKKPNLHIPALAGE
jgi:hypothetical protein